MKVKEINFNSKFEKLLAGLVEGEDVTNFSVDYNVKPRTIQILIGDWSVELFEDGKWNIG